MMWDLSASAMLTRIFLNSSNQKRYCDYIWEMRQTEQTLVNAVRAESWREKMRLVAQ